VQGLSSPLALAAVVAINDLVACITHEVIQEALHEVCMRLLITYPTPDVPQATHWSLSMFSACCIPQLRITFPALLTAILMLPLRSVALSSGRSRVFFHRLNVNVGLVEIHSISHSVTTPYSLRASASLHVKEYTCNSLTGYRQKPSMRPAQELVRKDERWLWADRDLNLGAYSHG
jgi:hypothetical protein